MNLSKNYWNLVIVAVLIVLGLENLHPQVSASASPVCQRLPVCQTSPPGLCMRRFARAQA